MVGDGDWEMSLSAKIKRGTHRRGDGDHVGKLGISVITSVVWWE
jgi:hypothetical protein